MTKKIFVAVAISIFSTQIETATFGDDLFSAASFRKHVAKLKLRMPTGDFKIVIQKPFVVVGDDSKEIVERWASGTIQWTIDRIKKQYFSKEPEAIIDIWLFKNKDSYQRNCEHIVGYKPHTPYGFYSSTKRAIIMNITTGGGTLVHEIVHPYIESNFPECPAWFNEGLASLYEQCRDNDGKIWGSTNWRLRNLQLQIESDRLPSLEALCKTTAEEFYNSQQGDNYAQARYLCFYLQEKNLLGKFYRSFNKNVRHDSSGLQALKDVLQSNDLKKFDDHWRAFCLKLRFPE